MGHHLFQPGRHRRHGYRHRESRGYDNGDGDGYRYDDIAPVRGPRIPGTVIVGGIALWSLLALGLWGLVDPLLAWATGMAGPASDLGVGFMRWFGLEREAVALREAANVEGLAGWAVGPLHFLAKAALILVWLAGAVALVVARAILRGRFR